MKKVKESPCIRCRRVAEPEKCDNKECPLWRHWYVERWDELREQYRKLMNVQPSDDPCEHCLVPAGFCFEVCSTRKNWEAGQ